MGSDVKTSNLFFEIVNDYLQKNFQNGTKSGHFENRRIAKTMRDLFRLAIDDRFVWQLMSESGLVYRV